MKYFLVDVFAVQPLSGNGLAVVLLDRDLPSQTLLSITQEFKQFETIFVAPKTAAGYPIRIFTVDEELDFAGHPILGAGAVVHEHFYSSQTELEFNFCCADRQISIKTEAVGDYFKVVMNQGIPQFIKTISPADYHLIAAALNVAVPDIDPNYPVEVVSTGLPYLLVPLATNLANARVITAGFETLLGKFGAKFVYLFDPKTLECRTWDNSGRVEDIATGSAAGPLGAYLVKNKFKKAGKVIRISQGSFVDRPSQIEVWLSEDQLNPTVFIAGAVAFFGRGELFI